MLPAGPGPQCAADIVASLARAARLACYLSSPLALPPRLPAASYNPTVALLESSSLAQIAMLSFGMRLRFTSHLLVSPSWHGVVCVLRYVAVPGRASRLRWLSSHGPVPLLPTDEGQLHHHAQLRHHAQLHPHAPHPPLAAPSSRQVSAFHFAASAAANDQVCAAGFPFLPGGASPAAS